VLGPLCLVDRSFWFPLGGALRHAPKWPLAFKYGAKETTKKMERSAFISINSASRANRAGTTPSDYIATFPDVPRVCAIQVVSAEIPNGQYQLNQYNNALDVSVNGGAVQSVSIEQGNYSVTDLAVATQTALQLIDPSFTVAFSPTTDRLRITHATLPFVLLFASGPSAAISASTTLGFLRDSDFEAAASGGSFVAFAPYIVQLQGDAYVNLCLLGIGSIANTESVPDVMAKVVLPSATRTASLRSLVAPLVWFDQPLGSFRQVRVCLLRPDGRLYDGNNMDHSFTLQVWQASY
jgi:hypothetical protein